VNVVLFAVTAIDENSLQVLEILGVTFHQVDGIVLERRPPSGFDDLSGLEVERQPKSVWCPWVGVLVRRLVP
jgi:hypothetical protein